MKAHNKIIFLLSVLQKKKLIILGVLLIIGMFFEMLGLGVMIPAFGILLKNDIVNEYPKLKPYISILGNPSYMQLVLYGMFLIILLYIIKSIFLYFLYKYQSKFTTSFSYEIAFRLFRGYLFQPYSFHLQRNSSTLLKNIQGEVNLFSSVTTSFMVLTTELVIIFGAFGLLFFIEPLGAISIISFLIFSSFIFHLVTKKWLIEWGLKRQLFETSINKNLLEGLGGIKDIKLLGVEKHFLSKFESDYLEKSKLQTKQLTLQQVPRLYLEILTMAGLAGLVIVMLLEGHTKEELLPILGVFIAAAFRFIPSVNRIMGCLQLIKYGKPAVDLFYDEFNLIEKEGQSNYLLERINNFPYTNGLTINKLSFNYPNSNLLLFKNVTLQIKKGDTIGFIGSSGSGKSTLMDLIIGLHIPNEGEILVDKKNIKSDLRSWQKLIGYVPQSVYLTDDSLKRNIAFGLADDEIDDLKIKKALKLSQLENYILTLPEGIETPVGERGVRLSGGQKQRIGIARALYHDPEILILDEATSSLDVLTEQEVMSSVYLLQKQKTILIVAHRTSTLTECNWIYKLENGAIVSEGKPIDMLN